MANPLKHLMTQCRLALDIFFKIWQQMSVPSSLRLFILHLLLLYWFLPLEKEEHDRLLTNSILKGLLAAVAGLRMTT